METKTGKRIVSRGEYVFRKTLAIILSVCLIVCGSSIALLLLSLPVSQHMDRVRTAHLPPPVWSRERFYYTDLAMDGAFLLTPLLLCCAIGLWWGKRRTWKAVEAIQPIDAANTADLPAPDSLVRASSEPLQAQEGVLLRAAAHEQETPPEQLVRAAGGTE